MFKLNFLHIQLFSSLHWCTWISNIVLMIDFFHSSSFILMPAHSNVISTEVFSISIVPAHSMHILLFVLDHRNNTQQQCSLPSNNVTILGKFVALQLCQSCEKVHKNSTLDSSSSGALSLLGTQGGHLSELIHVRRQSTVPIFTTSWPIDPLSKYRFSGNDIMLNLTVTVCFRKCKQNMYQLQIH